MKTVYVSAIAMIDPDGRVLIAQRPEGKSMAGMWEFPGGKVEPGETPDICIIREIREEMGVELCENCIAPLTFVSHAYDDFHLVMFLYVGRKWDGIPQSLENQALRWVKPQEMTSLPMPPADIPLVAALRDFIQ